MKDERPFKKWDKGQKNLIVTFAGNGLVIGGWPIFEFNRSLSKMNLPCDVMFMKDMTEKWYLGGLKGLGKNIHHTITFLRRGIQNYDKVIFIGASAGGYASILFGSLLEVDAVVGFNPQTDLNYAKKQCKEWRGKPICNPKLHKLKTFKKYNNLKFSINSTTQYFINSNDDNKDKLHAVHHYENISKFPNVSRLDKTAGELIKSGELKKLLKSLLSSNM